MNFTSFKREVKKIILISPLLQNLLIKFTEKTPRVFVYHRFLPAGINHPDRVSSDIFKWQLELISKNFRVMTFCKLLDFFYNHRKWPKRCAIITVDDGYRDFFLYGYPVLRELGLEATFFVTTNFIDRKIWLWPDRLNAALFNTNKQYLDVTFSSNKIILSLKSDSEKNTAWKILCDYCVSISNKERKEFIQKIETTLDVILQDLPSEGYEASNWEELREMAQNNIEIGSHSLNHPILSRVGPEELAIEVSKSKFVLEEMLAVPIKTFCYPNSYPADINDEVIKNVVAAGYLGAVFWTDLSRWDPYQVPRMVISNDRNDFISKLFGLNLLNYKFIKLINRLVHK